MNALTTIKTPVTASQFADLMIQRTDMLASLIRAIDEADNNEDSNREAAGDRTNLIVMAREYVAETERLGREGWSQAADAATAATNG